MSDFWMYVGLLPLLIFHPAFLFGIGFVWVSAAASSVWAASRLERNENEPAPQMLAAKRSAVMNVRLIALNTGLGVMSSLASAGSEGTPGPTAGRISEILAWAALIILPFIIGTYIRTSLLFLAAGRARSKRPPYAGRIQAWIVASPPVMLALWFACILFFVSASYPNGMFN